VLGSGEPVVVLNTAELMKSARGMRIQPVFSTAAPDVGEEAPSQRILVVDDSITTRTLEKNILEAAGYTVYTATDGTRALQQLKAHPTISLVVADVEMPNMDGIALTRYLRDSKAHQELPIILVTSLESAEDRERGMVAGANAYIVKRGFNQAELLATIQQFLLG
jgi:two-component system chemotaxis sensor kinase CheA